MNGLEIRQKRKELGLTQKELAEKLGISFQTLNGYENGKEIPATKNQILDTILNKNDISEHNNEKKEKDYFTITNNKDVLRLEKEVSNLETSLERKNKEIEFLRNNINKQVDIINKQYSQITEQNDRIAKLNDRIAKLNDRIAEQNNQIAKLNDQMNKKQ